MSVTDIFRGKFPMVNIHGTSWYVKEITGSAHDIISCGKEPVIIQSLFITYGGGRGRRRWIFLGTGEHLRYPPFLLNSTETL